MSIELVPLCTITAEMRAPIDLGETPSGGRLIFEAEGARVTGERLCGTMKGRANADWFIVAPDGTGTVDVRALLETDDGALVFIQYLGRVDASRQGAPIYIAPRFETSDDRYRWLNLIQAVGKGIFDGRTLTYEVYEII